MFKMPQCIVKGCTNRSSTKSHKQEELEKSMKITFHSLPKSGTRRQLWLNSLGLNESSLPKQVTVCSCHFRNEDFDRTSLSCIRLRSHAVPFIQGTEDVGEKSSKYTEVSEGLSSCLCLLLKQESNDLNILSERAERSIEKIEDRSMDISFNEPLEKISRISPQRSECLQSLLQKRDASVQVRVSYADKSTSVSPERIFHSPTKDALRKHIVELKKSHQQKLRVLNQKFRRYTARMETLKTTVQLLEKKNSLQDEQI